MKRKINILLVLSIFIFTFVFMGLNHTILKADIYNPDLNYIYEVDVDNPKTINEIIEDINLQAFIGEEDLSNYIINVNGADYTNQVLNRSQAFMRNLGDYELEFEVTSPYGVTSKCKILVVVSDKAAPLVLEEYSKLEYTFLRSDIESGKAYNVIKNSIVAVDNHDMFNIFLRVGEVDFSNVVDNKCVINVEVYDTSYNTTNQNVTINIIDDLGVRITMNSAYTILDPELTLSPEDIMERINVQATDSEGNQLEITIDSPAPEYYNEAGIHTLTMKATDSKGNFNIADHIIFVADKNAPSFFIGTTRVFVYSDSLYSNEQFENIIRMKAGGNRDYNYTVVNDQYTDNYNKPGEYDYELELVYLNEDGSESDEKLDLHFVMKVVDTNKDSGEIVSEFNFFKKLWNGIKKIGEIIIDVIKWPISFLETYF